MQKLTGSYYTPHKLAGFIWKYIYDNFKLHNKNVTVLEPSCGNGIFIKTASETKADISFHIDAIDINKEALIYAKNSLPNKNGHIKINFINDDFLKIQVTPKYDIIVGNPPYIGIKSLSTEQRSQCREIQINGGLDGKNIRNIWPAFVIKATSLLKEKGILAFVLPSELLQTTYAKKVQSFLLDHYESIQILTFNETIFTELTQDVVILFAFKHSKQKGVRYAEVDNTSCLKGKIHFTKQLNENSNNLKWSNFIIEDSDIKFLFEIEKQLGKVSDYCSTTPGVVTGANNFFIIKEKVAQSYELEPFCKPIIQKSTIVNNAVTIEKSILNNLKKSGKPYLLIDLPGTLKDDLPKRVKEYLELGVEQDIHKRFKCSIRHPWYKIPAIWVPKGFFFKRSYLYPKIVKNNTNALVTDGAYRIIPFENINVESIVLSFYNSMTIIFCELRGRFYCDGVLELTPNEFKSLPLPFKSIEGEKFNEFKRFFKKNTFDDILKKNDEVLLSDLCLSKMDLQRLYNIRKKLIMRRLKKQNRKKE